jgi:hypothetical protein
VLVVCASVRRRFPFVRASETVSSGSGWGASICPHARMLLRVRFIGDDRLGQEGLQRHAGQVDLRPRSILGGGGCDTRQFVVGPSRGCRSQKSSQVRHFGPTCA